MTGPPRRWEGVRRFGQRFSLFIVLFLPSVLLLSSLIGFPIYVILERDLELHGVRVTGVVEQYELSHGKRGLEIHNYLVRYYAGDDEYEAWITKGDDKLKRGDAVEVYYAPLFPRYAQPGRIMGDRWDDSLLGRAAAHLFITLACAFMVFGLIRRYFRESRDSEKAEENTPSK